MHKFNFKKIREKLANNVISYRKNAKLSQKELANLSGVNITHIGYIENMRTSATIDTINKLSYALNVDPTLLLARCNINFPGTGIKKAKLTHLNLQEGEACFAFWTKEFGMEFHPIANNTLQNSLHMMALLQANNITGKDLLDKSKKLHIPFKK